MSPIVLPFTQSLPVAKLDIAISELDAVCYAGLTVPAVPVPSRAGVGVTVGSEDQGSVDSVRESEVVGLAAPSPADLRRQHHQPLRSRPGELGVPREFAAPCDFDCGAVRPPIRVHR